MVADCPAKLTVQPPATPEKYPLPTNDPLPGGFDVDKADWLKHQAQQTFVELSDEELESVAGGYQWVYRLTMEIDCAAMPG